MNRPGEADRKNDTTRRFRKSALHRPGRKVLHPGFADDPSVDHLVHGARTVPSEPVGEVLASQYPSNPVLRFRRDVAEASYASKTREPLGKSFVRGHVLPEGLGTRKGFGVESNVAPTSSVVKDMVFPPKQGDFGSVLLLGDALGSDAHRMYVASHGTYAPGERLIVVSRDLGARARGSIYPTPGDVTRARAQSLNIFKEDLA